MDRRMDAIRCGNLTAVVLTLISLASVALAQGGRPGFTPTARNHRVVLLPTRGNTGAPPDGTYQCILRVRNGMLAPVPDQAGPGPCWFWKKDIGATGPTRHPSRSSTVVNDASLAAFGSQVAFKRADKGPPETDGTYYCLLLARKGTVAWVDYCEIEMGPHGEVS